MAYHDSNLNDIIRQKKTSLDGLSSIESKSRLSIYGENKISGEKPISKFKIFINQFKDVLIYILLAATVLSALVQEYFDSIVILAILIVNGVFGFIQEYKAEKAISLLKKYAKVECKVIRDKEIVVIDSIEIVPGDVVLLEEGDKIPADIRLIEAKNLRTDEAILTGESNPVEKNLTILNKNIPLAERLNMLYAGTTVVRGKGQGIVVETAMNTELGKIAKLVEVVEETQTPLQIKLKEIGKVLGEAILLIASIVFIIGWFRGIPFLDIALTSIALAVAAVPEGLPAVVTGSLSVSVHRMIKKNALIKKLKAIETLGSITVIASDKTGTLTKNEMTAKKIFANNKIFDVTGSGYNDKGDFLFNNKKIDPKYLHKILEVAITCNNATDKIGDPTERALYFIAKKGNVSRLARKDEIPFDSNKKFMATIHEGFEYYKGAPEVILDKCTHLDIENRKKILSNLDKINILKVNHKLAEEALRVLAFAYKENNKMVFLGLIGMIDPPRLEVKEAVMLCRKAGIRPIMITGDHPITALAIGKQIGLESKVIDGQSLDKLKKEQLKKVVSQYDIFARTTSENKLRILEALQKDGQITAMTGDGINDAPSVKEADVGVAMAKKGTDVTRDVADIVLMDDNFSSIVSAVEEGRIVYDNIKKFVKFLLGANMAEVLTVFIALLIGLPLPLLALQLLWLNLITDSLPALALGVTPPEKNVMQRKPRNPNESFFKNITSFIIIAGLLGTIITLFIFWFYLDEGIAKAQTMALTAFIVSELIFVFSCQSEQAFTKLFENKWLVNACLLAFIMHLLVLYIPILSQLFHLVPINLKDWTIVFIFSSSRFFIIEFKKLITERYDLLGKSEQSQHN